MLQFGDQIVNFSQELVAIRVRRVCKEIRRMLGNCLLTDHAGPAPDITVGQQGKSTQVGTAARVLHLAEQIVKLKRKERCGHAALQHFPVG